MKKSYLLFSFVSVLVLGFFSFGVGNGGASSLTSLEEKSIIELHEEFFGPIKRSATEEEFEKINAAIEEKLKIDNEFKMEEVLKELGLEDVGFLEPDSSDSVKSLNSDEYEFEDGNVQSNAR